MNCASGQESPKQLPSGAKILGWTVGQEDAKISQLARYNEDVVPFKWG